MAYYQFRDSETLEPYGSFEVFYDDDDRGRNFDGDGDPVPAGWYWWACFPGGLPEDEPSGPFATEAEAIADAQEIRG